MKSVAALLFIILSALISPTAKAACHSFEDILRLEELSFLTPTQINEVNASANWSDDKTLVAFCFETSCYVAKPCEEHIKLIDISRTVSLSYFGLNPSYERLEAMPLLTSWSERDVFSALHGCRTEANKPVDATEDNPDMYAILIRTRIWIDSQRYTNCELILVQNDIPLWR